METKYLERLYTPLSLSQSLFVLVLNLSPNTNILDSWQVESS